MAEILAPTEANYTLLARHLAGGGLVGVPTETVYGLAGNALDPAACKAIFQAKQRPWQDPLIVHLRDPADIAAYARPPPWLDVLAGRFWPGPLTVVLPKREVISDLVTAGLPSVAIRIPAHPVFRKLLAACDLPLAAPSANPFGYISPTTAGHVEESLGEVVPYVLDGGPCRHGIESTILDLRDPEKPAILRLGVIGAEAIEAAAGRPILRPKSAAGTAAAREPAVAPGTLARHYSPRSPLRIHPYPLTGAALDALPPGWVALFFTRPQPTAGSGPPAHCHWLSEAGDHSEAAANLYAVLRKIDATAPAGILAELPPPGSLGSAITDRLLRAAAK
ncbi:MAG: threonylcarbamoyl-AMP synthase [Puniceicoccaceae bacterium]|nr:MAG: threonylcarbamoyl-AMP synthase [Puniceicoccaceae bacterium]